MKRIAALVILAAMLSACTSRTEFGECVGIGDDKKLDLTYKVSAWNLFVGVFFFQLIAPPIVVAVDQFYCPVGKK